MILKIYNEWHPYLLFIDLEFNNQELVQFSGLLFKNIDEDNGIYQLMRSCNQYVSSKVCYPFIEYTNITNNFLEENGITLKDLQLIIKDDLLGDINPAELLVISHGLRNDRIVLNMAGISILSSYYGEDDKLLPIDGYCTFTNARRILDRANHLTLEDIATEAGYYLHHAHNAYNDVWAEVSVYSFLKKIEEQQRLEKLNKVGEEDVKTKS